MDESHPVTADFLARPRSGRLPLTVSFMDLTNGDPISWSWDFGDGQTSNEQNPVHIYTNPGYYTIKLTVADSEGSDIAIKANHIYAYIAQDRIIINSGILNGVKIDPAVPEIRVPEGAEILGRLDTSVSNAHEASALFPVGATPTWGDRETSYWTAVKHAPTGETDHTVVIDLTAPPGAGTYYIIMVCAAQMDVAYIMSCTNNGEVWNDGNDVVDWDEEIIQRAIDQGYVNALWLVDEGRYSAAMQTGATAVKVIVEGRKPLITAETSGNGTILPAGNVEVSRGADMTFTIAPDPCHHIVDVLVDSESVGAVTEYELTKITTDHRIRAIFAVDTPAITATAEARGNIRPSGETPVDCGADKRFTITPDEGYYIKDVLVDDESIGAVTTYTFVEVTDDHTIHATFAISDYVITAAISGHGFVSPDNMKVDHGSDLTFTIAPDPCYHIADVLVDNESVGPVMTYTFEDIKSDHTIEAIFAQTIHIIRSIAGEHGIVSPSGEVRVTCGERQAFHITPDEGYHISELVVDGKRVNPVTEYAFENVTSDHTLGVTFAVNDYVITAAAGEHGSIFPSGNVEVAHGADLTFSITPDEGYHILDVIVNGESVGDPTEYSFTGIESNYTIEAIFSVNRYTILAVAGDHGSISPSGALEVSFGEDLTLEITPDEGYYVADVLVDGEPVGAVTTYTFSSVAADHTIEAVFELYIYTITAATSGHGSISPPDMKVPHGAARTFAITPDPCHHIADVLMDGVSVGTAQAFGKGLSEIGETGASAPVTEYTFENVTSDHVIHAVFEIDTHIIESTSGDNGSISPSGDVAVNCGVYQTFHIEPDEGYHILDVTVDGRSMGHMPDYTFDNVMSDHTIHATFGINKYDIIDAAGVHGTITPSGGSVDHGKDLTLTITPDPCHHVADVLVDGVSVGPVTQYTLENVTSEHGIHAIFERDIYTIIATARANGSIFPSDDVKVGCGEGPTFRIEPDPCYHIADVLADGQSMGTVAEYAFQNVTSDHTINAVFERNSHAITATSGDHGNIHPSGEVTIDCGESQTFTIEPDPCYHVADVLVNGEPIGAVTEFIFRDVSSEHTIEAIFEIDSYAIVSSADANGSILPSGEVMVNCGTHQTFHITPDEGHHILDVALDGESAGAVNEYTFENVASDHAIDAVFEINRYNITPITGQNGRIIPSSAMNVDHGAEVTFIITPEPCYYTADVLIDGHSVGAMSQYTFENVTSGHTIEAQFSISSYTITAKAGEGGSISPSGSVTAQCGETRTFSITPVRGYQVNDVLIDGASIGTATTYAFRDVMSHHSIEVAFIDAEPPLGSVIVNSGAQYGSDQEVILELSAQDTTGVVSQMRFSNDNITYSAWEPYATAKEWQLSAGDGRKTVYVQFADAAGNISTITISDSIMLDTTPPTGSLVINGGGKYCNSTSVLLSLSATDSSGDVTMMRFSNDGRAFSPPEAYNNSKTWELASGDGSKTVYVEFMDAVGNWSTVAIIDSVILDTTPPAVVDASSTSDTENIPINAPIEINFSEDIDENSVSISVSGSISGNISGKVSYRDGTLTFVPDGSFSDKESIKIEITALDLAANRIAYSVGFTAGISVWPGDTNRDGAVNILDVLPVGKYWGEKGKPRIPAAIEWEAQSAVPWGKEEATYADADGNGIIDADDLLVIDLNWGQGHPATTAPIIASPGIEQLRARLAMLIDLPEADQIPIRSSLGQNYPNPLNPETWIPYQLADGSYVTVRIYNVSGHLVRTLDLGYRDAGTYATKAKAAHWDGRNDSGESVSSGIYFYTIKAGSFTDTRKLIVTF